MKKFILCALVSLTSSLSFAQSNPTFLVRSDGAFCYQTVEDAFQYALPGLQKTADSICEEGKAIRVTDISQLFSGCVLTLQAEFICE